MEVLKYCWMYETSNMQCTYNSFIQIINFMGFSIALWGAEKLVPAEYWCPYGIVLYVTIIVEFASMHVINTQWYSHQWQLVVREVILV